MPYPYYFDPLSFAFHLLGWILIIWLVVWLIRGSRSNRHMHMHDMWNMRHDNKALDLLKERYAKGEINKEEYEEKKAVLDNKN